MDIFLVAFATVPNIGPSRTKLLIDYFGSAQKAWESSDKELAQTGLPKNALGELLKQKKNINPLQYYTNIVKRGIKVITIEDSNYPESLKTIVDPPLVLFFKSNLSAKQFKELASQKLIGVVGTRKMTPYGLEVTQDLVTGLVGAGFVIVSGMALGVDGAAHETTIDARGKTVAVLGAGVEVVYPPSHRQLYDQILESGGVIISEVAPEKLVNKGIFPARNRIISGLSKAVLVTQGALDSGSLITARLALEQGREVFAVPGPINSAMAEGTNYLLKNGAKMVTSVADIFDGLGEDYNYKQKNSQNNNSKTPKGETVEEQRVLDQLYIEPLEFGQLVRETKISASNLGGILGKMEIEGKIKQSDNKYRL